MTGHDRIQDRRQDKGTGPKDRTVQSIERSTGLDREKNRVQGRDQDRGQGRRQDRREENRLEERTH